MNLSRWLLATGVVLGAHVTQAADATTTIDYTQRNGPFVPQSSVTPSKTTPATNHTIQDARVEKDVRDKQPAAVGDRRAPIAVTEKSPKTVREKESQRPEVREQPMNPMSGRRAQISTDAATRKPPMVAKYQDSLAAASATNMARFPALDGTTKATINRFVFRKNAPEGSGVAESGAVTPAAGGSPVRR